jgi:hypothetical protein
MFLRRFGHHCSQAAIHLFLGDVFLVGRDGPAMSKRINEISAAVAIKLVLNFAFRLGSSGGRLGGNFVDILLHRS